MTVGELIEQLQAAPKDYEVFSDGDLDIEKVEVDNSDNAVIIWAS